MTTDPLLLAVDQGTSATKALLVNAAGDVVSSASAPLAAAHPRPGWVEQSAEEIWQSVRTAVSSCLEGHDPARVAGLGLSSQRESCLLWERHSGRPLGPVLGWQDRRTADACAKLLAGGTGPDIRTTTGLPLDPMFSALKAQWLLDTHDPDRVRARRGELCVGTVDSWLLWRLSGGAEHLVEVGNAARTQLLDIRTRDWDARLLELFDVPRQALPRIVASTGPFPAVSALPPLAAGTPVAAVLGDSHAALFGHGVFVPGSVKATYGTGSSVMGLVTGPEQAENSPLCLTVAWDDGTPAYALEGNIRSSGATLRWLAGLLRTDEAELTALAAPDSAGVHLVPAFGGLAAPWWDNDATGLISGLTFAAGPPELARAALESVAFQVEDVVAGLDTPAGRVTRLLVDGGPSDNAVLMQLQADVSGRTVVRPHVRDLSALGAAHLAGRSLGIFSEQQLADLAKPGEMYRSQWSAAERHRRIEDWSGAIARARLGRGQVRRRE
ncbi:FGGY family carbohydrate kinase [Streptomyces sp. AK04-3B]|uniref:FGGY family carbohydrate kinase n=1 Tax=unclassified Streptomyces TaxID=2593676 RepID=UPI00299FC755|nr:FGGY family carbohydrate kinase [Streptomyces sp. AK04-3B]MDX3798256.1 FGGY family carbohydrate kinase [Streptomyces sp. AK04-3B]